MNSFPRSHATARPQLYKLNFTSGFTSTPSCSQKNPPSINISCVTFKTGSIIFIKFFRFIQTYPHWSPLLAQLSYVTRCSLTDSAPSLVCSPSAPHAICACARLFTLHTRMPIQRHTRDVRMRLHNRSGSVLLTTAPLSRPTTSQFVKYVQYHRKTNKNCSKTQKFFFYYYLFTVFFVFTVASNAKSI